MKLFICILVMILSITRVSGNKNSTLTRDEHEFVPNFKKEQRFMNYISEYESPLLENLLKFKPEFISSRNQDGVNFFLHTRRGVENLNFHKNAAFNYSNFNKARPVKIIVHGWLNSNESPFSVIVTRAFLRSGDLNVIVVDWSAGACTMYPTAVTIAHTVGAHVAELIDWLNSNGIPLKSFHLIGHSLGAHIVGIAGRSIANGKVPYITALDPALPMWAKSEFKVASGDADYVEVIHTNSGFMGLIYPLGDNDFYPNGGISQPKCITEDFICCHNSAFRYFADSVDGKIYMGYQCSNYYELMMGWCGRFSAMPMGGSNPKRAVGVFYLETSAY